MKLVKYDKIENSGGGNTILGSTTTIENNPSRGDSGTRSGERTIWGQDDEGDNDIDGTATIHGNVLIKSISEKTYDPDDDDDDEGEDVEEETGGGNLDVEGDAYIQGHLYINTTHPDHAGEKKCVGELIQANADNIKKNADAIDGLDTKVSNLTARVSENETVLNNEIKRAKEEESNIKVSIANETIRAKAEEERLEGLINAHGGDIDDIKEEIANGLSEDAIKKLIQEATIKYELGNANHPIILASGQWYRGANYTDNSHYFFSGSTHDRVSLQSIPTIEGGLLTATIKANNWSWDEYEYQVCVTSVVATQSKSKKTEDLTFTSGTKRSRGAHWFECQVDARYNTSKIYIREFSQQNSDNDSWQTSGWFNDDGIEEVNVIIAGYIARLDKTSTASEEDY